MDNKAAARIKVTGRVQGVFFRATARDMARSLGLSGWVRNLADGSVEVLAEGEAEKVKEMIAWCNHGPSSAMVSKVLTEWVKPSGGEGFHITW